MQQVQITIYVPPNSVGAIIGRGGRTVLNVQREAMKRNAGHVASVRISVLGDTVADDEEYTPVLIKGDPVGSFSAVRQILPLVDREHDPDIVLEVPIHRAKHNMLVGKGGITLAALSATYKTRIMIPPNEFMSNVNSGTEGGENIWKQRQAQHDGVGSAMLFGGGDAIRNQMSFNTNNSAAQPGTPPPNIIQLEGDIDKVEHCLIKMLSIVAGEKYTPTGKIIVRQNGIFSSPDPSATYAEAVIYNIWTSDGIQDKIRQVQRKTNTIIWRKALRRRELLRLRDLSADATLVNENDGDDDEDEAEPDDEPGLVNEEEENYEAEGGNEEVSAAGENTCTKQQINGKCVISGKTEDVKLAAAQIEKILGLEPGSAIVTDISLKVNSRGDISADKNANARARAGARARDANARARAGKSENDRAGKGSVPMSKNQQKKQKKQQEKQQADRQRKYEKRQRYVRKKAQKLEESRTRDEGG
ncbi:hypothetical protein ACHAXR_007930 [Thalassiosira sp. AJA248-18]